MLLSVLIKPKDETAEVSVACQTEVNEDRTPAARTWPLAPSGPDLICSSIMLTAAVGLGTG